jgi:hypothetical protein
MSLVVNGREFNDTAHFAREGRGCATSRPSAYEIARNDRLISALRAKEKPRGAAVIPVNFVHFTRGGRGVISDERRQAQLEVINTSFSEFGIKFIEQQVTHVDNDGWYCMDKDSREERAAKTELGEDPRKTLNFYTGCLARGLLGWASFPWYLAGDPARDGIVVTDNSLPGGAEGPYNLGMTAVHEIGHWFGLFHTFESGCSGFGDHVADTPAHAEENYGKPADGQRHNACHPDEVAPVRNFMNYVDDEWMNEFTEGQKSRIWAQLRTYRSDLLVEGGSGL